MNYKHQLNPLVIVRGSILLLILFAILFSPTGCNPKNQSPKDNTTNDSTKLDPNRVSWNILFQQGTDSGTRGQTIRGIRDYVNSFYKRFDSVNQANYHADINDSIVCYCDTLLYNVNFLPLDESGKSVTTSPSPPAPGQAGELVSNNESITDSSTRVPGQSDKGQIHLDPKGKIDDSKILAIIDSGVDSALLPPFFSNMLWKDPTSPGSTLYNFIPGENKFNKFDNTSVKHGSAVAAIILKTMEKAHTYPKIMVLKALNAQGTGSIFSVSCALSYAIQKEATLVNMSLGYYGTKPDPILHRYLGLSQQNPKQPIEVFVAAGNGQGDHDAAMLCGTSNSNELGNPLMFYPACFTIDFEKITSVTQIRREDTPCVYQNYSNKFVSLGIYDKRNCCMLPVYFNDGIRYYEGSSFATPAASGLKMNSLLAGGPWPIRNSTKKVTVDGKYIEYSPNP